MQTYVLAALCMAAPLVAFSQAPNPIPSADRQVAIINAMRQYAESYAAGLPNFLCTQVTTHYQSGTRHEKWHKGDVVVAQVSYSDGTEHNLIRSINNKPAPPGVRPWRWSLSTAGEFGPVLLHIFAPDSEARFEWKGWEEVNGVRTAVFLFNISQSTSTLKLSSFGVSAIVAYGGELWAEPDTGRVLRIQDEARDIPEELRIDRIGTLLEFGTIEIAGKQYLLPTRSEINEKTGQQLKRNIIEFRDYRKFSAESTLAFGDPQ